MMTTVTRIKDNSPISADVLLGVPHITGKIANKTLDRLKTEDIFIFPNVFENTEDLSEDQMVLQSINNAYRTGNVMGFLGCGQERLTISSRFSVGTEDYFLYYLLERVLQYPNVFDLEISGDNNDILDLLMFLFPGFLQKAMRKGLFKTYIRMQYNDSRPKGTIDIARHIKENTPFTGNITYNRREYSYDNDLTELIRHAIECIKQKPGGNQLLHFAKDEVKTVVEATSNYRLHDRNRILVNNQKNIIRHAYFYEYRALQQLCILILQNQKQAVGLNGHRMYGILFDGAWLWEEYVNTLICDWFYHPRNKAGKGQQWLFSGKNNTLTGKIYPDFIGRNGENTIIADAKYKPLGNIASHDYCQVLAYMWRFEANRGFYLYPESAHNEDTYLWLNRGSSFTTVSKQQRDVLLIKHGLKLPESAENYRDYCEKMKKAEKEFCQVFCPCN